MQYVSSGIFFARGKVGRIVKRAGLETDVFTAARLRLPDKKKELRKPRAEVGTFGDARVKYEAETYNGYTSREKRLIKLAPKSIAYRLRCVECLARTLVECLYFPNRTW